MDASGSAPPAGDRRGRGRPRGSKSKGLRFSKPPKRSSSASPPSRPAVDLSAPLRPGTQLEFQLRYGAAVEAPKETIVKSFRVNKCILDNPAGKTHHIQNLEGKIQSKGNMNFYTLGVSGNGQTILQNARSSQCIIDSSPLRICSASESFMPSPQPLSHSQLSSNKDLFVKQSDVWNAVDAMQEVKDHPQKPHYDTLQEHPRGMREGMAIGMMVSFANLVKFTMEASIDNNMEWFEDKITTISHLEKNGFNMQFMQSTMKDLVKIKSECTSYDVEIGMLDLKIMEKTALSSRVGAVLDEKDVAAAKLEQELGRIRQERQKIAEEKEKVDSEATNMKTKLSGYHDLRSGAKRKFDDAMSALRRKRLS